MRIWALYLARRYATGEDFFLLCKRVAALCAVLAFPLGAAGCGGHSSPSPMPPVPGPADGAPQTGTPLPTDAPTTASVASSKTFTIVGRISYVTQGRFEIQGGRHLGYMWIYTNSGTKWSYNRLKLQPNEYATITGNGSLQSSITATSVSLSTTGTPGVVSSGPGASGNATPPPSNNTPAPAPPPASADTPAHVQTAEYLYSPAEKRTDPGTYAPYLTWAYTATGNMGRTQSAGIKTVIYTSPIMPQKGSAEYRSITTTYPNVRDRDCSGHITTTYRGNGLLAGPERSGAASYFSAVIGDAVKHVESSNGGYAHPYSLVFLDNAGPLYGASPMPCKYDASSWSRQLDSDLAVTKQPIILNDLSVSAENLPTYIARLNAPNITGGEYEHCFDDGQWSVEENAQLETIAALKRSGKAGGAGFWCYVDGTNRSGASIPSLRLYQYASFLLGYDPNYSVFQESYATPSTFKVYPETQFVPLDPSTRPDNIEELRTSSGAYVQTFAHCYYRRSALGACEVVVNPNSSSVSVPNPQGLHHSMSLDGAGVLDGGTATFGGAAPRTLAARQAAILVP